MGSPPGPGRFQGRTGNGGSCGMPSRKRLAMVATSKPGTQRVSSAARIPPSARPTRGAGTLRVIRGQPRRMHNVKSPIAKSSQRTVGRARVSAPTLSMYSSGISGTESPRKSLS